MSPPDLYRPNSGRGSLCLTVLCLASMVAALSQNGHELPFYEETTVYTEQTDGNAAYRIPAIISAPNGNLLAICEGRIDNYAVLDWGNHDIVMKRSTDHGRTWGSLKVVVNYADYLERLNATTVFAGDMSPVVDDTTSIIWMPFSMIADYTPESGRFTVWITSSADNGHTWSQPAEITDAITADDWTYNSIGPGHAIQLANGRLLIPGSHRDTTGIVTSHVFFSDDHGITWERGGTVGPYTSESTVVELADGRVMINMRNGRAEGTQFRRRVAVSEVGGLNWGPVWNDPQPVEPKCQASILRYSLPGGEQPGQHIQRFLASIPKFEIVLDIGVGHGTDLMLARKVNPHAVLHAIEVYPEYIQELVEMGINVHPGNIESDAISFGDGEMDVIITNQVLEHTKEVFWIFHQITRVLPIKGNLIIGVPSLASLHNRILLLMGRQPSPIQTNSAHVRGFTKGDILRFMESCFPSGYKLVAFGGSNFYPFPPIIARPLAKILPTMAWGIFLMFEKQRNYDREFLDFPVASQLETNFYLGDM